MKLEELESVEEEIKSKNNSKNKEEEQLQKLIEIYNKILKIVEPIVIGTTIADKLILNDKLELLRARLLNIFAYIDRNDIEVITDWKSPIIYTPKTIERKMALSKTEFLNLCARTITHVYKGEPIGLKPFILSIDLLESMAETGENENILTRFILTKLEGNALECIPKSTQSPTLNITIIKEALKAKIKPENSKVIVGKLLAIKADRTNLADSN